jgi:hypothetical protein
MNTLGKLNTLTNVAGNASIDLLRSYADDETLKAAFEAAYNPNYNFWIVEFPLVEDRNEGLVTLLEAIEHIKNLESRSASAIQGLVNLASGMYQSDEEVLRRILKRDLRCGINASTVNKVWTNLIPKYPVMLCRDADEKNRKHIQFPAFVQTKLDGMRINIHVSNDGVEVFSRNGKPLTTHGMFDHLTELTLDDTGESVSIVIDGELVFDFGDLHNRQTGNGLGNKAIRGTISPDEAEGMVVVAWDIIPLNEFKKGFFDYGYDFRFQILEEKQTRLNPPRLRIVKSVVAVNWDEVNTAFAEHLSSGEEGVIVKNFNAPWENKRSKHMQKLKAELDAELRIVGFLEGNGKFEGMIGSIIMETDDKKIRVNVSGMSDAFRDEISSTPDAYLDKIATVRYNQLIKAKNKDIYALYLPRLVMLRDDKDETNLFNDFK